MSGRDDWRAPTVAIARRAFQFLDERGAKVTVEDHATDTTIVYLLAAASFEIELDWREEATFVLVCRATGFKETPGYYMHEGRLMRVHLADALTRVGLMDPGLRESLRAATRPSGEQAMHAQLELFGSVLEAEIDELSERYGQIFT